MLCYKELETLFKVKKCLESDGFSVAKMVYELELLRTGESESNSKKDIYYNMNDFKLIADDYNENIEVTEIK